MQRPLRVLVVEDSEFDARMLVGLLKAGGFNPTFKRVETASQMDEALSREGWEMILADYNLPEFSAPEAIKVLRDSKLDIPFIIVSGFFKSSKTSILDFTPVISIKEIKKNLYIIFKKNSYV